MASFPERIGKSSSRQFENYQDLKVFFSSQAQVLIEKKDLLDRRPSSNHKGQRQSPMKGQGVQLRALGGNRDW